MGSGNSKPTTSTDPFAGCDTKKSDRIKQGLEKFKRFKRYNSIVKEHTPSIKPKDLYHEIGKGGEISKMPFAPEPLCIEYSIFDPEEASKMDLNEAVVHFDKSDYTSIKLLGKALGSIYGMLIGDSWGHPLEFVPVQYEKVIMTALDESNYSAPGTLNKFRLLPGQYTDDSSMGLCLADTLLVNGNVNCVDLRKRFVMWWYLGYNNAFRYDDTSRKETMRRGRSVGLGGQISFSLKSFIDDPTQKYSSGDENMSGNGSIMRLCPLPIFYRNAPLKEVVVESMCQSFTTHSGIQSAECAALLSFYIIAAMQSDAKSGKEFLDSVDVEPMIEYLHTDGVKCIAHSKQNEVYEQDTFNKVDEDQNWNWKDEGYRYSPTRSAINPGYIGGYACDNLAMSLHSVYNTDSFESAVLRVINRCGDADTVASVTGQIAGALYGISNVPASALQCVFKWDPKGEIPLRVFKMFKNEIAGLKK